MTTKGPPPPDGKRRLPLLPKVEVAAEGDEDRPPWHWSAIGAIGVFVLWLPLALLINGVIAAPRVDGDGGAGALPAILNGAAFALAAFTSGFLVGRFGGKAGRREATVGGVAAAGTAWIIAASQSARAAQGPVVWVLLLAILAGVGGGAARAGGALGVKRRGGGG